jgi:hypothetical protein
VWFWRLRPYSPVAARLETAGRSIDTTRAEMTKETRTREQLAEMVLKEAHATGKCTDLHSVVVLGPVTQGRSNWHIGTSSNGPNLVSAPCRMELNLIVGRLQAKYDLAGE